MATGISGDNTGVVISGDPVSELILIEMRTQNALLQQLLGSNGQAIDQLEFLRNDAAFALGVSTPLPGASL